MYQAARIEILYKHKSSNNKTLARVYTVYAQLSKDQFLLIANPLLTNKNNWRVFLYNDKNIELIEPNFHNTQNNWWDKDSCIRNYIHSHQLISEISYHFGVTDNLANTLKKMIMQKFQHKYLSVYSAELIIGESHNFNSLVQKRQICTAGDKTVNLSKIQASKVKPAVQEFDLEKENLSEVSKNMLLGLSERAMIAIKEYFKKVGRNPTDIELESFAQTWSEHCKHTIFSAPIDDITEGLYKTYIKRATQEIMQKKEDFCISVFSDNAGAIKFTDEWLIAAKVETHNSPSALEPFGGAMTGILGVNRDIVGFGLGAKPVANMYGFCFADPNKEYNLFRDQVCKDPILLPQKIIDGVIEGVKVGGNCSGIPTIHGFVHYDQQFIAKPLVFVGTIGLIPSKICKKPSHIKKPQPGDYIVIIGGHTGKDGIHGATFSSEALSESSPQSAVQIGDPITQKKLSDALIKEVRDLGLYNAITDNGAGGLSSSVGEMGYNGFEVNLEQVPLKYPGMMPWEIWVSESQERMTLAVSPEKYSELCKIMCKHDVAIATIGTFNDTGKAIIKYNNKTILDLHSDFLHNGNPIEYLTTEEIELDSSTHCSQEINLQNNHIIAQQYDHEVQGSSVLKPLQGGGKISADAAVIRPVLHLEQGLALSHGLGIIYDDNKYDPYYIAANAIDTAIRNLIVVGVNPDKIALLDNFCWSNSTNQQRLWQLKRAAKACYDYAIAFNAPFISGKDSMFNDFKGFDHQGKAVHLTDPPTLLFTSIGVVDDVTKCVSLDAKFSGDLLYILGDNNQYMVDAKKALSLYKKLYQAINMELISSSISIGMGGLAYAIKRKILAGQLNVDLTNDKYSGNMYEEYPSRVLVTINLNDRENFEDLFVEDAILIGKVS